MTYSIELQNENDYFYVRLDAIGGVDFIICIQPIIRNWLTDNVSKFYITYDHYSDKIISLVLDSEEDAMAFKLMWL